MHTYDLICLSHLRWDFVYQRPQHLLSRCARQRRVFFVEEPVFGPDAAHMELRDSGGVTVAVPHLPEGLSESTTDLLQRSLLDDMIARQGIEPYVLWYYTPMARSFTRHLQPAAVVYDCMDELSAFKNPPPLLGARERELFRRADLVFTGGQSLYESKRMRHDRVHLFPSSVDVQHFGQARTAQPDPADQAGLPRPRIGYFGVIDERMDIDLVAEAASARPEWQFILVGPVVKIDESAIPRLANLHLLGRKQYDELPGYLANWDVAIIPFARNESTRYISPTKTPEYLAAGCPVVSTSIRDVVRPYGRKGLVRIADTAAEFNVAIEQALSEDRAARLALADAHLASMSWDRTWAQMSQLIEERVTAREPAPAPVQRTALRTSLRTA